MKWKLETPIKGGNGGCYCCYIDDTLDMKIGIAVGCGYAALTKNSEEIFVDSEGLDDKTLTVEEAELLAKEDPDNDWRIHLVAPLSERHYQRQGDKLWVLYKKGEGFA